MLRSHFWRKTCLTATAIVFASFLTACGGPSASEAGNQALEITKALYNGDLNPMLDHFDYSGSGIKSEEDKAAARKIINGKMEKMLEIQKVTIEARGGIDKVVVDKVEDQGENVFLVKLVTTYKNGETNSSDMKLKWNEEQKTYLIQK